MIGEVVECCAIGGVVLGAGYIFGPKALILGAGALGTSVKRLREQWDSELAGKKAKHDELDELDHRVKVATKRQEVIRQEVLTQRMYEAAQSGEVGLNTGKLMLTGRDVRESDIIEGKKRLPPTPMSRPIQQPIPSYPLDNPPEWMRVMTGIPSDPTIGSDATYIDRLNATYSPRSSSPNTTPTDAPE